MMRLPGRVEDENRYDDHGCGGFIPGVALLITGIVLNWELGLVMLACVPFIGGSVAVLSKLMSSSTQEGNDHYSKAGGVATEVCTGT